MQPFFFFFSSRRRHTRFDCDWSSDVCSSDLPREAGRVEHISTRNGERIAARQFVFACGPWLGKVFPDVLGSRIFPSRQEVFFFGIPGGDARFAPPALPTWLFQEDEVYGMPDIEGRGLKIAFDEHGERV